MSLFLTKHKLRMISIAQLFIENCQRNRIMKTGKQSKQNKMIMKIKTRIHSQS
jgi:hypothetical protein